MRWFVDVHVCVCTCVCVCVCACVHACMRACVHASAFCIILRVLYYTSYPCLSVFRQLLGKGSFGSVYCVRRINDRSLHVMKKISIHNMPQKERSATEQECKVLQRLRHPGIVCYEDSFIHKNRQVFTAQFTCFNGTKAQILTPKQLLASYVS